MFLDYAVQIFHDALNSGVHNCYLRPDCTLPMMYIDDCLRYFILQTYLQLFNQLIIKFLLFRSLHEMMIAPDENLSCRVYNVAGMSFTPDILLNAVRKHVPELEIKYNVDDRQKIG